MPANMSSRALLNALERFGQTGSWIWKFDTYEQVWSPGMFRILGLPIDTRPDYGLLHSLVHPDDLGILPSPADLLEAGSVREQRFRILCPDHSVRAVSSRIEVFFSPDGRPRRASGILLDTSDQAALVRAQAAERRRKRALFDNLRMFTSSTAMYPFRDFSNEWLELVGNPKEELLEEPTRPVLKEERQFWRDQGRACYLAGKVVHTRPRLRLADGSVVQYRMVMVPLFDNAGQVESWTNYVGPIDLQSPQLNGLREALEQKIDNRHLRAARALLGWSMTDLAKASGISLSTMRRLEDEDEPVGDRSLRKVVLALRQNGIQFALSDDSTILLGKK